MLRQATKRTCPVILRRDFYWLCSATNEPDNDVPIARIAWPPKRSIEEPLTSSETTLDVFVIESALENHLPPCNPVYCPCFQNHLDQYLGMSNGRICFDDEAQASQSPPPSAQSCNNTIDGPPPITSPAATNESLKTSDLFEQTPHEIVPVPYQQYNNQNTRLSQNCRRDEMPGKLKTTQSPNYQQVFSVLAAKSQTPYPNTLCQYGEQTLCVEQTPLHTPTKIRPRDKCNNLFFDNRNTPLLERRCHPSESENIFSEFIPCGYSPNFKKKTFGKGPFFLIGFLFGGSVVKTLAVK
ncbi:hypothetical protein O0L34_g5320 [Tuta absoluta]|nr:hypothetical protein O0L34_g5320 [Tuta absoluta]